MYRFYALKIQDENGSWSPIDCSLWEDCLEDALHVDGDEVIEILGEGDYVDLQFEDGFVLPAVFRGHLEEISP